MAELITLEGIAQEKGKKVIGYKFPDNLDDLKFPFKLLFHPNYATSLNEQIQKDNKITTKQLLNILPTDVIFVKRNGNKLITKEGYILSSFDKKSTLISPEKVSLDTISNTNNIIEKSPTSNTISNIKSNNTLEQDVNNSILGKTARKIQIGFSVVSWGVFGILAYKFWNKSTTWKVMLSVIGAYNIYNTYKIFSKPALKVSGGSNLNTGTGTGTTTTPLNSNLTKAQKIGLIVTTLSDPEQKEMDVFNKNFISTLSDTELNIWIKLSKALRDDEIKKFNELEETPSNKDKFFKLFQSKYGLSQKQVEEQMKKFGEALMKGFEKGMTQATEQVLEQGLKGSSNTSAFSNFESSLDLDI